MPARMGKRANGASQPAGKAQKLNLPPWVNKLLLVAQKLGWNQCSGFYNISSLLLSRNFDPMKDEHPVAWLLDSLKPEVFEPLHEWLTELLGDAVKLPNAFQVPDRFFPSFSPFASAVMVLGVLVQLSARRKFGAFR